MKENFSFQKYSLKKILNFQFKDQISVFTN